MLDREKLCLQGNGKWRGEKHRRTMQNRSECILIETGEHRTKGRPSAGYMHGRINICISCVLKNEDVVSSQRRRWKVF